ncbi:Protease inhibitor precursor [compost metagenome]
MNAKAEKILTELAAKGVKVLEEEDDKDEEPAPPSDPDAIMVLLNGEIVNFQVPPIQQNGSVLVPFRAIFEALGLKVDWDPKTQTIKGSKPGTLIKLKVGSTTAEINGNQKKLTVAPSIIKGSTYVPLRFIGEAVDAKVDWLADIQAALIYTKQPFATKDKKIQVTGYGNWRDVTSSIENTGDHQLLLSLPEQNTILIQHYSKSDLDMNFEEYVSFVKKDITDEYAVEITEKSVKVGTIDAKQLTYRLSENNEMIEVQMILCEQNNEIYTLLSVFPSQASKKANAEFKELVKSIQLN